VATSAGGDRKPGSSFIPCRGCPEMVVLPAGRFTMGSPDDELGRGKDEGPQRSVRIDKLFAVSRFEITRAQYERFVRVTRRNVSGDCITDRRRSGEWRPDPKTDFRDPGYRQSGRHPVVCVSWQDALDYAAWLRAETGAPYRLLSEAEWEYAARAGTTTAYPWGPDAASGCAYMNGTDATARRKYATLDYVGDFGTCDDHSLNTAPVGSYRPNAFGLYDMIGNVGEWVADCSGPYRSGESPAAVGGNCERRVVRGGSWGTVARQLRSAERVNQRATDRDDSIGIRVALDLE
jgi:formylglycine-generating enzyme